MVRDMMSSLVGSRIQAFDWYRPPWPWMTLNGVIALILRFFSPNDCSVGQLRHSLPLLATINPPCSAVSPRWLSYLFILFLKENASRRIKTILDIVLKFQVNRACFQGGVASAGFGGTVEKEKERKLKGERIEHLQGFCVSNVRLSELFWVVYKSCAQS